MSRLSLHSMHMHHAIRLKFERWTPVLSALSVCLSWLPKGAKSISLGWSHLHSIWRQSVLQANQTSPTAFHRLWGSVFGLLSQLWKASPLFGILQSNSSPKLVKLKLRQFVRYCKLRVPQQQNLPASSHSSNLALLLETRASQLRQVPLVSLQAA